MLNLKKYIRLLLPTMGMDSVSRMSLNFELDRQFKKLKPGIVLEVGSGYSTCNKYVPSSEYLTLDINDKSNPDICSDLHNIKWKSDYFDTVLAIEVLEHIQNPQKAIDEMMRILKPGGTCIISTRFIHAYHPGPKDYYRFTWDSLYDIFKKFDTVKVYHHGNIIQSIWHLINDGTKRRSIFLNIFNPLIARINSKKTKCPCGFIVVAVK